MIDLRGISKSFTIQGKSLPILEVAEWQVQKGERLALIGPSGSGKSTLLHLLSGVMTPDHGEIWVDGQALHQLSESKRDRYRADNVGYIFQDFHLISSLTAKQNVELIVPREWTKKEAAEQLDYWFDRVGLKDRQHHLPSQLSRGQQQRAAIVRALIAKPQLILADEPTGSLDWETAGDIMSLLLEICGDEQLTLLTVTHDLHLADKFPKRVHIQDLNDLYRREAV
ncbi:putative ABC transport system ATP-binding protein [Paenibacillus sp. yr247]|uniref:ABC transporter ATP-binding protein n=1 Tax=Paenibacillus sp. yr247 TaxID=1761880 RepID=UPI000892412D|nr:ABC transporter ATP-binding protein [Paenibacillus sp. yr247]SDM87639.1 putative ABC transport system ATP-binding protein [Paenibacillus sp. yr247]